MWAMQDLTHRGGSEGGSKADLDIAAPPYHEDATVQEPSPAPAVREYTPSVGRSMRARESRCHASESPSDDLRWFRPASRRRWGRSGHVPEQAGLARGRDSLDGNSPDEAQAVAPSLRSQAVDEIARGSTTGG